MAYAPGRGRGRGRGGPAHSYGNRNFSHGSRDGMRHTEMRHPAQGNFYGDRRRSSSPSSYDRKRQASPNRHSPPHKKHFDSRVEDTYRKDRDRDRHEFSRRPSYSGQDQKRESDGRFGSGPPDRGGGSQNMGDPRDPSFPMNDPRHMMHESRLNSPLGSNAPSYPMGQQPALFPSGATVSSPLPPTAKPLKSILKKKPTVSEASNTPPSVDEKSRLDERGPGGYGPGGENPRVPGGYGPGLVPREELTQKLGPEQMFNRGRAPALPGMSTYIEPDDEDRFLYGEDAGQRISRESDLNRRLPQGAPGHWMQPDDGRRPYNTDLQDRNIPSASSSYGGSSITGGLGLTSKGGITALSDESMSTIQAALASLKHGAAPPSRTQELSQQRQQEILSGLPNISSNLLSGLGNLSSSLLSTGTTRQQSSDSLPGLGGQSSDFLSRIQSSQSRKQVETSMRFGREDEFDKYQQPDKEPKKDETTNTIQNILQSIGFDFGMSKRMQELAREKEEKENKSKEKPITIDHTASFLGGGLSDADLTAGLFKRKRSTIAEPEEGKKRESPEQPVHKIESVLSSKRRNEPVTSVPQVTYPPTDPAHFDPYASYPVPQAMPYFPQNPYNAPTEASVSDYYNSYPPMDPASLQLEETIPFKRPKFDGRESISSERLRSRSRSRSSSRSRSVRRSSSRSPRGRSPSDLRSSRRESSDMSSRRRGSLSPRRRSSRDRSPRRRGRSPGRRSSRSPGRRSSRSPGRRSSRSPSRKSPGRRSSRSPGRRSSRSPSRKSPGRRSRSPGRRHSRSPGKRHSSPGKRDSRRRGSRSPRRESRDGDRHGRLQDGKSSRSRDDHRKFSTEGAPRASFNDRHDSSKDKQKNPAISDFRIEIGKGADSRRVLSTSKIPEPKRGPSPESTRIVLMPKTEHIRKITVAPKIKSDESSSKPLSKSEKPEVPPEVKEKLRQEHEDRQKKLEILEKEMEKLRKQQNEIMRKRQRQKDGHKDPLLTANSKLQEEISEQIKALRKACLEQTDIPTGKEDSSKDGAAATSESQKNQRTVKYIDNGKHWCKCCNEVCDLVLNYCQHLKTKGHLKKVDPYDRPWMTHSLNKVPPANDDSLPKEPISGVEFIMSVDAFYCSLCNAFMGDATSTEAHLKDHLHNKNYQNYLKKNPFYEKRWNLEKNAKIEILKEEKEKAKIKTEALARMKSNQEKEAKIKEREKKWHKEVKDLSDEKKGVNPTQLISDAMVKKAQSELKLKLAQVKKDKGDGDKDDEKHKGMFTWKKEGKLVNKPVLLGEEEESVETEPAKPAGPKLFLPKSSESHYPVPGETKDSKNSNKNPKTNSWNSGKSGNETEERDKKEKLVPIIIGRKTRSKTSAQALPSWTPVTRKIPGQKDTRKLPPQPQSQQQSKAQAENPVSLDKFLSVGKTGKKAVPIVSDSIPIPPPVNRPLITAKTQQEVMAALEQKKISASGVATSIGGTKMGPEEGLQIQGVDPPSVVHSLAPDSLPPIPGIQSLPPCVSASVPAVPMNQPFTEEPKPSTEITGKDVLSYDVPMELESDESSELPDKNKDSPNDSDAISVELKATKEDPAQKESNEGKDSISSQTLGPELESNITTEDNISKKTSDDEEKISSNSKPIQEENKVNETEINQNFETGDKQSLPNETIENISNSNSENNGSTETELGNKMDVQELTEVKDNGVTGNELTTESDKKEIVEINVNHEKIKESKNLQESKDIELKDNQMETEDDEKVMIELSSDPEKVKESEDKELGKESLVVEDSAAIVMETDTPTEIGDTKTDQESACIGTESGNSSEQGKVLQEDEGNQVVSTDSNTDIGDKVLTNGVQAEEGVCPDRGEAIGEEDLSGRDQSEETAIAGRAQTDEPDFAGRVQLEETACLGVAKVQEEAFTGGVQPEETTITDAALSEEAACPGGAKVQEEAFTGGPQPEALTGGVQSGDVCTGERTDPAISLGEEITQEIKVTLEKENDPTEESGDKIEENKEQVSLEKGEQLQDMDDSSVVASSANIAGNEDRVEKEQSLEKIEEIVSAITENFDGIQYAESKFEGMEYVENKRNSPDENIIQLPEQLEDSGQFGKSDLPKQLENSDHFGKDEMTVLASIDQEISKDSDDFTILDLSENISDNDDNSVSGINPTVPVKLDAELFNPDSDNSQNTIIMDNPEELGNLRDFNEDAIGQCSNVSVTEGDGDLVGLSVSLVDNFSEDCESNKRFDPCLADSIADETASLDLGITVLEASDSADQEETTICPDEFKGISLQMTGEEEELDISDGTSLGSSVEMGSDFEVVDECEEDQDG